MSDTAALIANLDLVVSTCTSIPHLSAALGIRTYTLLSYVADWRWGLNREDSNYYPTLKLIRQDFLGQWERPIQRIYEIIRNYHTKISE
jgi:ADP-heptose:LPS heptosyltransferase